MDGDTGTAVLQNAAVNGFRLFLTLVSLWILGAACGRAVEITQGPLVEPTPTNAVIRWRTDRTAGGRVVYGTAVREMTQRASADAVSSQQEVRIQELKPGTTYWYAVGTARLTLATNSFTTPGMASEPATGVSAAQRDRDAGGAKSRVPGGGATGPLAGKFDPTKLQAPPARQTWGAPRSLQDHFDRHGADFSAKDPEDYAAQAWVFLRRAKAEGLPAKLDDDGVLRVYEPKTRSFAAYNKDLTTRTYFKPGRRDYFDDQPGRPVDLNQWVK